MAVYNNKRKRSKEWKEAIGGWASEVSRRLMASYWIQMTKTAIEKRIAKSIERAFKKSSSREMEKQERGLFSLVFGSYDFGGDISNSIVTLQEKIKRIFDQHGINVDFLEEHNISILEFARFVVDFAKELRKHKGKENASKEEQEEIMTKVAFLLIQTRYKRFDLEVIPKLVKSFDGKISLVFQVAMSFTLMTELRLEATSADDIIANTSKTRAGYEIGSRGEHVVIESIDQKIIGQEEHEPQSIQYKSE